jgi:hypothetical protein
MDGTYMGLYLRRSPEEARRRQGVEIVPMVVLMAISWMNLIDRTWSRGCRCEVRSELLQPFNWAHAASELLTSVRGMRTKYWRR